MSVPELIALGFQSVCTPTGLLLMLVCTAIGIVFGAIPGLTATMAVALFLPVTYGMDPIIAMAVLMALYTGGVSGGLISAILLKIPGTPSSVATCFDGHPMMDRGEGPRALGVGVFYSFVGAMLSIAALMFIAPNLARLAVRFGYFEKFAIAVFSLTMIATLSSKNLIKGVFSGVLGFMISTIGIAPVDAAQRFTFGMIQLGAGFDMLTVMIGLFAISEILATAQTSRLPDQTEIIKPDMKSIRGFGFSIREFRSQIWNMIRSGLIGIGIGILPGIGGGTANIVAYSVAQNQSKYPEKFGTGIIDGIVASETSNNAAVGGALIPLLTLGIPGDTVTAMLLGGLMIHGLSPGPLLFDNNADLVYGIFAALIISTIFMLILEFYGMRGFAQLLAIPKYILLPCVFVLCCVGAYGLNSRIFDIWAVIIFGVLGYLFSQFKIPIPPFILGFILGPMAETNLRRGLMLTKGDFLPFLTAPIAAVFLLVALAVIVVTAVKELRGFYAKVKEAQGAESAIK